MSNDNVSGGETTAEEIPLYGLDDIEGEPTPALDENEPSEEDEAEEAPESEPEEEAPKPKPKPKGFIKKLNRAEAERDAERQRVQQLQAELDRFKSGAKPQAPQETKLKEPVAADFEDPNAPDRGYGKYLAALRQYDRQMAIEEMRGELGKRDAETKAQQEEQQALIQLHQHVNTYNSKLEAYEAENPGTTAKIQAALEQVDVPEVLEGLVLKSSNPVEMADYLADNLDTLAALSQVRDFGQMQLALARLEGMLEGAKNSQPAKRQTQAKPPIKPIGGLKARTSVPNDFNDIDQDVLEREILGLGRKRPR